MDQWAVRDDDRPLTRPQRKAGLWPALLVVGALALAAGGYLYQGRYRAAETPPAPAARPQPPAAAPQQDAIRHPIAAPQAAAQGLPTLENSDSMMREALAGLIGGKAFAELVVPDMLVRRIVATVDNLPRRTAPRRMLPLTPVPGQLVTAASADEATIEPANYARYAPYVRVMEALDSRALVYSYARAYPLFQRAYEDLGYPGRYFNDRLIEAIDDLLASPQIDAPVRLLRPKVLYEFSDPELETRSAGQKILIRIGPENAARVKAKLREIRAEVLSASEAKRGQNK